ncbi:MAG: hypothetical protein KAG18_05145, partial [Sinobacterium sp.]|nr:hypothetical protein [Sinobacterium sp.]
MHNLMNIISIDYSSSITDAFEAFSNDTHAVLLESAGDNNAAHYSFFSAQPSQVLSQDINNINSA